VGHLTRGRLLCPSPGGRGWVEHRLNHDEAGAGATSDDGGSTTCGHGSDDDDCDHPLVPHGDHVDRLVSGRLVHVLCDKAGKCCPDGGSGSRRHRDHGAVVVLRRGRAGEGGAGAGVRDQSLLQIAGLDDGSSDAGEAAEAIFHVDGLCCASEERLVRSALAAVGPGVLQVRIQVVTRTVRVLHRPRLAPVSVLAEALNAAGLSATLHRGSRTAAVAGTSASHVARFLAALPPPMLLVAVVLAAVGFGSYAAPEPGPGDNGAAARYLPRGGAASHLAWCSLAAVALAGPPVALRAIRSVRRGHLDINALMSIAVVAAVALGDLTEAGAVVVLFGLAQWLESRTLRRATRELEELAGLADDMARLWPGGEEIPAADVRPGQLLLIRPGDAAVVDGTVLAVNDGTGTMTPMVTVGETDDVLALLDESIVTGEAEPIGKRAGDRVLAGTLNVGASSFGLRATAPPEESTLAHLGRLVAEATAQKTRGEALVERLARWYTPLALLCAFLVAVVGSAADPDAWRDRVYFALVLLVTACPCALVIATPVSNICALTRAAHMGVLVKGGAYLEGLSRARIVFLDKTGTLTQGAFRVRHAEALTDANLGGSPGAGAGLDLGSALAYAASVERFSQHPLASSLVRHATALGLEALPGPTRDFTLVAGVGVGAEVGGRRVEVVSGRVALADWDIPVMCDAWIRSRALEEEGQTTCWIRVDGRPAALVGVSDAVRPSAAEAVAALSRLGLSPRVLTGDAPAVAANVARAAGVPEGSVFAGLLPADKVSAVVAAGTSSAPALHVGDGVNDAPALAAAGVGIAFGAAASPVALETADVAVLSGDLTLLAAAIRLARRTGRVLRFCLGFAFATKMVALGLAAGKRLPLWAAVFLDVGSSLVVVLAGLTLLRWGGRGKDAVPALAAHDRRVQEVAPPGSPLRPGCSKGDAPLSSEPDACCGGSAALPAAKSACCGENDDVCGGGGSGATREGDVDC